MTKKELHEGYAVLEVEREYSKSAVYTTSLIKDIKGEWVMLHRVNAAGLIELGKRLEILVGQLGNK